MQTESPEVAALWVAWLITEKATASMSQGSNIKERAQLMTQVFADTYKGIRDATKASRQAKSVQVG